jgi:hypothetical protein
MSELGLGHSDHINQMITLIVITLTVNTFLNGERTWLEDVGLLFESGDDSLDGGLEVFVNDRRR